MSKPISKMTNPELKKFCKEENIDVVSKNVSKPTKTEYLAAIKLSYATPTEPEEVDSIDEIEESDEDFLKNDFEEKPKPAKVVEVKETRSQKRKKQRNEMFALKRVIITSNDDSQTKVNNMVNYVTWGNRLLGHQTDRVIFGKPWHVRVGALNNLKDNILYKSIQDDEGNSVKTQTMPKYNIVYLDKLTEDEIELIAKRQTIRNSALDSLI